MRSNMAALSVKLAVLHLVVVTLAFAQATTTTAAEGSPEKRPNILLILADNWRWPNAGVLGDSLAKTPTFDRIAREGVLFTHAFNPVPSCSPTRACLLTGKCAHQLGERASLWSAFPQDTPVVTDLLRQAGYQTGFAGKGWGPGNFEVSGWKENPVGAKFESFANFAQNRDKSKPFFFWLGNTDTATRGGRHPYLETALAKLDAKKLVVPKELPDCPEVRHDLLNYYGGIIRLDEQAAEAVALLEKSGDLDNTVVVFASDNGWQLPRGLANCYDAGSRVPLAIRWGQKLQAGRRVDAFINVADLAPTFLQIAGITPPKEMSMHGFRELLLGEKDPYSRESVFLERERHADVRREHQSYPIRAMRTRDFLYIRNLRPDRWPAGDPDVYFLHERPYGDVDTTAVKDVLLAHQNDPAFQKYVSLIFAKRPAEELYDLRKDPDQLQNVVEDPSHAERLAELRSLVQNWMQATDDPRIDPKFDGFDTFRYYGSPPKSRP
ncbi:sulfatase [Anatilimnocola sp. NA78]|uniref:sulfatase family protein n=1 Tax=Anatilimnocola sp. NA78 TaxID=3415683 RepID=UPI003CE503C3